MTQKKTVRPQFTTPPPTQRAPLDPVIERLPALNDQSDPTIFRSPAVVDPRSLTDAEKAGLTLVGVDPTKPVPREALEKLADLPPEVLQGLITPAARAHQAAVARATASPVVPTRAQRIEDLPADQQAAARATMRGILEANDQPDPALPQPKQVSRFPVMDDRPRAAPPPPPPPPPPEPESEIPVSDAGGAGAPAVICPRCGWDCREADTVQVTDEDRQNFLACVLALPARRFSKRYDLFGGRLSVTFGELTPYQQDDATRAVHLRANADAAENNPGAMPYYMNMAANYRMALALQVIENSSQRFELEGGWADARRQKKTLQDYYDWVSETVAPTDSILVVLRRSHDEFVQLCQKLREAAADPDFYGAIG